MSDEKASLEEAVPVPSAQKETTATVDLDALRDEVFAAGATAERERICKILDSDDGKAKPKAAHSLALKTPLGVEEALAALADMPEERASSETALDRAMANMTPKLGHDPKGEPAPDSPRTLARRVHEVSARARGETV